MVRLDQTEAREIGNGAQLIVKRDCLGVVHSKQDFICGVNAHIMDSRTENMIARLNRTRRISRPLKRSVS
ncbi:MAG: hypothetical protein WBV25_09925 [Methylocella sp.]